MTEYRYSLDLLLEFRRDSILRIRARMFARASSNSVSEVLWACPAWWRMGKFLSTRVQRPRSKKFWERQVFFGLHGLKCLERWLERRKKNTRELYQRSWRIFCDCKRREKFQDSLLPTDDLDSSSDVVCVSRKRQNGKYPLIGSGGALIH